MRGQTRTAGPGIQSARSQDNGRPRPQRRRSAGRALWGAVEALEGRTLLSTVTWDGGGVDNNWTTPANWLGDVAPVAGDDLVFGNPAAARKTTNTNNFAAGFVFGSIRFSDTGYTLAGNAIELNAGFVVGGDDGVDNATGTNIVGLTSVKLGDGQTWTNGGTTLTFNSPIDTNGQALTIDGAGATTLAGAVTGGGSLVKDGAGTATLGGAGTHSYAGLTTVNAGTLRVTNANVTATTITVANTATLDVGNVILSRNITLQSGATLRGSGGNAARSNGVMTLPATGTVTLSTVASGDVFTLGDATNDLTGGGAGLAITVSGAGRVHLNNDSNLNAGVKWRVTAGLLGIGGDLRLGTLPAATVSDYLVLNGGGLFTPSTATVTLDARRGILIGPASGTGSATFNVDNSTLTVNGIVANNGTSVTSLAKAGSGRMVLAAAAGNTFGGAGAAVNVNAGALQIANDNQLGNAANEINLSNATIIFSTNLTTARPLELVTGTGTVEVTATGTTVNLQPIAGTAGTTLQKTGNGTLAVTAANPLPASISLTLTAGTLDLGSQSDSINNLFLRGGELRTTGTVTHTTRDIRGGVLRAKLAGGPVTFTKTSTTPLIVAEANALSGYALVVRGGTATLGAVGVAGSAAQGLTGLSASQGSVVIAAGGAIGAGPLAVTDGGTLLADPGAGNTAAFATTTGTVNVGRIQVRSGILDLGAGAQVAVAAGGSVQAVNGLQGRLLETRTGYAIDSTAGITNALAVNPANRAVLTNALSFTNDAGFAGFFGNPNLDGIGNSFTAAFTGFFTPKVNGLHTFAISNNDDRAVIWVDTNSSGTFDAGEMLVNDGTVAGATTSGTATLTSGTRYRIAIAVEDTGGGSALVAQFAEPAVAGATVTALTQITPSSASQANLWSFDTVVGGGTVDVSPGAVLRAGNVTGGATVNLQNLGLQERVYRGVFSNSGVFSATTVGAGGGESLNPTINPASILARTPSATYDSPGPINFPGTAGANVLQDRAQQLLSLGTGADQFGMAFVGRIHVGPGGSLPAGNVSFGLDSDDASSIWIDREGDGFEADDRVVTASNATATATVNLLAGDYNFAIAWQEGSGNERLTARFKAGAAVPLGSQDIIDPTSLAQAGTWLLPGAGAGTLELTGTGSPSSLDRVRVSGLNSAGAIVVGAGGSVTVTDLVLAADGTLTRSGAGALEVGTQTYAAGSTFAVTEGTTRLTGAGAGAGAVAVTGAGTVLLVDDELASAVSVGAGATLGGNGTVSGAATVAAGATVAPGGSTGRLTLAAPAMTGAGLAVELGGTAAGAAVSGYDQLVVTGPVDLTGMALTLSLTGGFTPTGGQAFVIVRNDGAGPVTGRFAGLTTSGQITTINGQLYRIHYDYDAADGSVGDGNDVALIAHADVTSRLSTVRGGYRLNRATNRFQQQLTFTNTSGAAIGGKLTLVLKDLPPGVSLFGATTTVDGYPAIELSIPGGTLAAGQSVSFVIDFVNPTRIGINYNLQVVAPVP